MRPGDRKPNQMRNIKLIPNYAHHADGSCLIEMGNTHVLCTASIDNFVPAFIKNTGQGWLTAEYGMLPRSTGSRMKREAAQGKQGGRTVEIQRLIGRSLRSAVDFKKLGERQIIIDCDVINADGGTRAAAITGGFVALHIAMNKLVKERVIKENPLKFQIAAISCGIRGGTPIVDLEYEEDSDAAVDANFVMTSTGQIIEIQGSAEKEPFSVEEFNQMLELAQNASSKLFNAQMAVLLGL